MRDTKYFPLTGYSDDGEGELVPLFPVTDKDVITKSHTIWLEEVVPHYFNLCTKNAYEPRVEGNIAVFCPLCGKELELLSTLKNNYRRRVYVCSSCVND